MTYSPPPWTLRGRFAMALQPLAISCVRAAIPPE
ncbi:hypothetical protein KR51_00028980, partial [Rubidibacter lacunae KORDI 51-2]